MRLREAVTGITVPRAYAVPVELSFLTLKKGQLNAFAIYLYLKSVSRGQVRLCPLIWAHMQRTTRLGEKACRNGLKWLLKRNWIGYNPTSRIHHIRGFEAVCRNEGLHQKRAWLFEINELENVKRFVIAAVIGEIHRRIRVKRMRDEVQRRGSTKQKSRIPPCARVPLSNSYLAKCLGVSIKTAYKYKQIASTGTDAPIVVERSEELILPKGTVKQTKFLNQQREAHEPFYFWRRDGIFEVQPDFVSILLIPCRRRKKKRIPARA